MRRQIWMIILCLCALLTTGCALAEPVEPDDVFFDRGKDAMMLLASGDVDGALDVLKFSFEAGSSQSEEDFKRFVSDAFSLLDCGAVQSEVAVCWLDEGGMWHLGIPVVEPVTGDVEALVLDSWDLTAFSGYSASTWGRVQEAVAKSWAFYWNEEYLPAAPVLLADE